MTHYIENEAAKAECCAEGNNPIALTQDDQNSS
jgi:hypothetical protein